MKLDDQNLQQRLANDYIMGLMNSRARKNFEKRMSRDASLRTLVQKTEGLWNRLSLTAPEQQPPLKVWVNISQRILQDSPSNITQLRKNFRSVKAPTPSNRWLKTWATAASISTIGLAIFASVNLAPTTSKQSQQFVQNETPQLLTVLINTQQQAGWLMRYEAQNKRLHVQTLQAEPLDSRRTYELWIIADGLNQPESLGLMPEVGEYNLPLNEQQIALLGKVQKFAVSVEPAGGSPTGQPTSSPVYLGEISKI
ncbi:hypothetical protein THMIRHAS_10160 [Thiosulfatimonas sediminis]|uniref:Anti-sigma K factor RskA C-terminal domain-containing protein n=1 Tax=Thiosulfatimonas sediminis TaxID=2675054 RepID=A0A6F8PU26_9GAMM|nr:anti-sigma factor [Thiosulfatimonas sediminis]BBP45643.1 hypothetical protein THMIRHAS_10160 [Thiosulfatimonas sediminis]